MNFVSIVLFVCCSIGGVFSDPKCQVQSQDGKFMKGCEIGNLTVTDADNLTIINGTSCNLKNTRGYIPQYMKFHNLSRNVSQSQSYLLAVVDLTTNQLLGLLSNLTMQNGTIHTSSKINPNIQTIKGWNAYPNPISANHTIQYLVFEEHRNNSGSNYTADWTLSLSPFNLFVWVKSQESSGISICGPVAGGDAVLLPPQESPQTTTAAPKPTPPPPPTTTTTTTTTTTVKPSNSGNKLKCVKKCMKINNEKGRKKCVKKC
ncbi:uncharacterized protein LOC135839237 [Planococcus citri]|uniref:uncharacterized protein LOC135839237 n=1 Tax=Planococcus citri TaxID=170843 RepID=UPI0031F896FA